MNNLFIKKKKVAPNLLWPNWKFPVLTLTANNYFYLNSIQVAQNITFFAKNKKEK